MKKYLKYYVAFFLLATGLFGFSLLLRPVPNATGESRGIDCEKVAFTSRVMMTRIKPNPTWLESGTPEYQKNWLALHNLIIDQSECFSPEAVANARADMQSYLGH